MQKFFSFLETNRRLFLQYFMVFTAFSVMVVISNYYGSGIVRENIEAYGEKAISLSAETMNAYLNDSASDLDHMAFAVERLHENNAGIEMIRQEIKAWTERMHLKNELDESISFFGFIYDTFIDGNNWIPASDFIPQSRPWYIGAYAHNGGICFSEPYFDAQTGKNSISISKLVVDKNNEAFGVMATDIFISDLESYVENMHFLGNGYGVLFDNQQRFAVHPNDEFIGKRLVDADDGSGEFINISNLLSSGKDLFAFSYSSYTDEDSILFLKRLDNGWYLSIVLPRDVYYIDIQNMKFIMMLAGIILALSLCGVLTYMHIKVIRSKEESRIKSSFLANMSHEIRTPMNAIIGMSEFLQYEKLNDRQLNLVNDIHSSAKSLLTIINEILDMSKIEAGKLSLMPVNYDFYKFLDDIISMIKYMTDNKGLGFKFDTSGDIPRYIFGDDIRLKQILTNLCGNAVKFTGRGYVSLRVIALDETILFEIKDTGRGISKNEMPTIFDPFEQSKSKQNRELVGTGLGLPITRNYVEMMGGKIMIESELGKGTTFTVEIPMVKGSADDIEDEEKEQKEQKLIASQADILVVDDNEFNLKTIIALLGLFEIKAKSAASGKEAVKYVQKEKFDIVFMDHMMPEMDGIETTNEIRRLGTKFNNLIIIALTANAIYGAREMFLSNGFNDYISKPVEVYDLKNILIKWLPKEKMTLIDSLPGEKTLSDSEKEFKITLQRLFVKNNRDKHKEIITALNDGDVSKAHRLAHTLKSNAGQIGKKQLKNAASEVELYLMYGKNHASEEQLKTLENELNIVIEELSPLMSENPVSSANKTILINKESIKDMIDKLDLLLKSGNPECLEYVETLKELPETGLLVKQIEDFEFDNAFLSLLDVKKRLNCV